IAFGGAGPLHAPTLGRELSTDEVLIPKSPGVFSALGLLTTDLKYDFSKTYLKKLRDLSEKELSLIFSELEDEVLERFKREGIFEVRFERAIDVRYFGQSFELTIPLKEMSKDEIEKRFKESYFRSYGHNLNSEIEVVNFRVSGISEIGKLEFKRLKSETKLADAFKGEREIYLGKSLMVPVYERTLLSQKTQIKGPAILEEEECTTLLSEGQKAFVDEYQNLIVKVR
ncbi:MAG: hydantoinase/oxoprolinase family protein, partial [Candidatus Methanofastidiosia archaeon]